MQFRSPSLSAALALGARAFDEGRFFEAHEAWEEQWIAESNQDRRVVLQGLIQIAAALHKLVDKQQLGPGSSLLAKGLAKLERAPGSFDGQNLTSFREAIRAFQAELQAGRIDARALPRLAPLR